MAEKAEGTITPDELVQEEPEEQTAPVDGNKSIEEVAREVIAGLWNRGNKRKKKLEAAGYDPAEVEKEVSKIFNR